MSLLNKIRKLFEEEEIQEEKPVGTLPFEELPKHIEDKTKQILAKKQEIRAQLEETISNFAMEIARMTSSLEKVDISKRKEYEKIKLVVRENLELYIAYLKRLADNLRRLEENDLERYISKIFSILSDFSRISHMPFEKATILIGKEMENAKMSIKTFAQSVNDIAESNKRFFEEAKLVDKINGILREKGQIDAVCKDSEKEIIKFDSKIRGMKEEHQNTTNERLNLKNSEDYRKDNEEKENYRKKQGELDREIQSMQQKIDFKALARIFHHDRRKAQIIKEYSNDFKTALKSDEALSFIGLIRGTKSADISGLEELRTRLLELNLPLITKTDKQISIFEERLKRIMSEIAAAESNINQEKKKQERLARKKEKIDLELRGLQNF